ncbi:hypothetical protein [Streptomyces sp. NPDC001889]
MTATSELDALLGAFDDSRRAVVEEAARAAGLLWQCRNTVCRKGDNPRAADLCHGCGHDRAGAPVSDDRPGVYPAPDELWEALREELRKQVATAVTPLPDAVTLLYRSEHKPVWSLTAPVLHYGGRTETGALTLAGTEAEAYLDDLADEVEPNYLEHLRITL